MSDVFWNRLWSGVMVGTGSSVFKQPCEQEKDDARFVQR